jgi:hypothetical protein
VKDGGNGTRYQDLLGRTLRRTLVGADDVVTECKVAVVVLATAMTLNTPLDVAVQLQTTTTTTTNSSCCSSIHGSLGRRTTTGTTLCSGRCPMGGTKRWEIVVVVVGWSGCCCVVISRLLELLSVGDKLSVLCDANEDSPWPL